MPNQFSKPAEFLFVCVAAYLCLFVRSIKHGPQNFIATKHSVISDNV